MEKLSSPNVKSQDLIVKQKREKLKKIQVRRSIKDILVDKNPCDCIYNYIGKNISVFHDYLSNNANGLKENCIQSEKGEINSSTDVISVIPIEENEKRMLEELNELLNKDDLSDEMKNNLKSLFIEVQGFYLEIKNDIKKNYPSTNNLLKLYYAIDCDKEKNMIWKNFCFYKLLNDKLRDLHISTLSSYRLQCLKSTYMWYKKNKRILFDQKSKKKVIMFDEAGIIENVINENTGDTHISICEEDTNVPQKNIDPVKNNVDAKEEEQITCEEDNNNDKKEKQEHIEQNDNEIIKSNDNINKDYVREESEELDQILKNYIHETKKQDVEEKEIVIYEKNELVNEKSNDTFLKYLFPNCALINPGECLSYEKGNEEAKDTYNQIECISSENLKMDGNLDFNSSTLEGEQDDFFQIPIDTKKINELEEEIKKQKLLIKEKEIEIINSPIGIKFKDIFGNFQDIDINS